MTRPTIDYLETLTPDQLGRLLILEVRKLSPSIAHIRDLLDVGCPIDARANMDWTALHWAAYMGHLGVARFLISRGADIEARDIDGRTAWDLAPEEIREAIPELNP